MRRPLDGRGIVNTRAIHQAETLNRLLLERGALPLAYPCIAIVPPPECTDLDRALDRLVRGDFDWLVLTSANTVTALAERLAARGMAGACSAVRVAAVGPATAAAARELLSVECVDLPPQYVAESLAESLGTSGALQPGARVLLPESAIARPTLAERLTALGALIEVVTAYETRCASGGVDLPALIAAARVDALTFTSSSTVSCFRQRLAAEGGRIDSLLDTCTVCIGSKTERTARELGFRRILVPAESTVEAMVDTLERHFE